MKKSKKNDAVLFVIILVLFIIAVFSFLDAANIKEDYKLTDSEYEELREFTTKVTKEESSGDLNTSVYTYKEIDWNSLKEINSDIVGWIYIPGTSVDYPVVQGETNDTYLRTTFKKEKASGGCIFMECENSPDFSDQNTILYGHNMRNGTMFHCLNSYSDKEFFDEHQIIQIMTPDWNRTYKIVSVHTDVNTGDSYKISFINTPYADWLNNMVSKSIQKGQEASFYKDTITLSVCHGKSGSTSRMVLNIQVADD